MKMRVADYIAEYLENQGVRAAFMLSGGGMMHLMDALGRREKLKYYCNHHEHACAISAEGYARKTGRLGVCYATSGPGATNTVTGVVECWQDSVPVLFLSGQSKLSQTIQGSGLHGLRQFGTFEADIISIVKPITKYAVFLNDPKTIRYHLEKACSLAVSGRPGPVFIDIPVDLQGALIDPETLVGYTETSFAEEVPARAVFAGIVDRIAKARRPLILAGHGIRCSGATTAFHALLERLGVPVVTTQHGSDLMEYDDPLYIGHPGMKGDRAGNFAIQSADLILTLGCSLHVLTTGYELDRFAPKAYKIQVDLDESLLKREQVNVNEKILCGLRTFMSELSLALDSRPQASSPLFNQKEWRDRCLLWKHELTVMKEPHKHLNDSINYYDLNNALSELCQGGETIVADAGSAFYVVGQAFRVKKDQRVLISGALGAMGHALPLAIGASIADSKSRVIALIGDGSFQTNIQELATLRHQNCNLKLFIVSNGGYVSIRNTQNNFFGGFLVGTSTSSGVSFPDLKKLAAAYDLPYLSVKARSELESTIRNALDTAGPVICEIFTPSEQEIIPTVSSFKRDDGTMESKPLHDMYPFMEPEVLKRYMS